MALKDFILDIEKKDLILGILEAKVKTSASDENLITKIKNLCQTIHHDQLEIDQITRKEIRDILRNKIFKPVGRAKPSNEYLYNTALKGESFPSINNIVDINNYLSLKTNCPLCIFDNDKTNYPITIRLGLVGESYIFNNSGQSIDLNSLLSITDSSGPFGNPIKDSMKTKISDKTTSIFGVIYSSKKICNESDMLIKLSLLKTLLLEHAAATDINFFTLSN